VDFGTDAWRSAHAHRAPPRSDSNGAVGEGRRTPRRRVRVVEDRGGRGHMRNSPGDRGGALRGRLPPARLGEEPVRTPPPPALAAVTGDRGAVRLDRSAGRRRRRPVDRWTGPRPRDGVCGDCRSDEGPTDREQDAGPPLEPRRRASGADAPRWGRQHAGEKRAASKAPAGRSSSHAPVRLLVGPSHSPFGGREAARPMPSPTRARGPRQMKSIPGLGSSCSPPRQTLLAAWAGSCVTAHVLRAACRGRCDAQRMALRRACTGLSGPYPAHVGWHRKANGDARDV
jgi:hypothetical protein